MKAPRTLLLGLGNATRGDDGAGWEVVCLFELLKVPGLETRMAQQLGPELVEEWGAWGRVVIVDAAVAETQVKLVKVGGNGSASAASTHHLTPEALLGLARALGNPCPELYVCRIPAHRFGFGETFSTDTQDHIHQAVKLLHNWLVAAAPSAVQDVEP